jgi:hypothetical protein
MAMTSSLRRIKEGVGTDAFSLTVEEKKGQQQLSQMSELNSLSAIETK